MGLNLAVAIVLFPAWVYLIGAAAAVMRFARRAPSLTLPRSRGREGWGADPPAVSVLKPLHGDEPGLYDNLRSFAEQDYPALQIVLGVNDPQDGALQAARALIRDLPACDIALVVDARASGSNKKVANLENMFEMARHDVIVLADSDMRVDRHYLGAVTAPLRDRQTGAVTCLYKGVPTGGKWSEFGAMHINFGFLPSALVAEFGGIGRRVFWRDDRIAPRHPRTYRRICASTRRTRRRSPNRRRGPRARAFCRPIALYRRGSRLRAESGRSVAARAALGAHGASNGARRLCWVGACPSCRNRRVRRGSGGIWLDRLDLSCDFLPPQMGHGAGHCGCTWPSASQAVAAAAARCLVVRRVRRQLFRANGLLAGSGFSRRGERPHDSRRR